MEHLNSFHDKFMDVTIYKRGKDLSEQETFFGNVFESIQNHGTKIGILGKDKAESPMIADWNNYLKKNGESSNFEFVDVSHAISSVIAIKDEEEQGLVKIASKCTSLIMENFVVDQLLTIIDDEKKVGHDAFSEKIESTILIPENPKKKMAVKFPSDTNLDYLEMCYPPIIQSGGNYSLRPSATSSSESIQFDTILCSLGVRYKSYCSNMSRTFLIEPTPTQETNYKFLLDLQKYIFAQIHPGLSLKALYEKGVEYVKENRPDLSQVLVTNFGFGIGLEFREADYLIGLKNEREFKQGMVFNIAIGFQDLIKEEPGESNKTSKYALFLADTVSVGKSENFILTEGLQKLEDISFFFKNDQEEDDEAETKAVKKNSKKKRTSGSGSESDEEYHPRLSGGVIKTRLRSQSGKNMLDTAAIKKRDEHQRELLKECIRQGLSQATHNGDSIDGLVAPLEEARIVESYKKETFLPTQETKELKIWVDKRADSVLLPMYGQAVPFHISTIKNVTKSDEGEFLYLRINFNLPAKSGTGPVPASSSMPVGAMGDPSLQFIRSLTFRSTDTYHMNQIFKEMTDLRKVVTAKETEKKQLADLVVQENLVEIKPSSSGGKRAIRLPDVYMRPAMEGKRVPGDLEIHSNGVRYRNILKGELKVDILFNNIKHMFFQPSDNELIVLIHFHLKHPILIGKKKTKDVQFYREATDAIVDDTVTGRGGFGRGK